MKDNQGNEYEIDHIDYATINKENRKKILDSDRFIEVQILVGTNDYQDVLQLESKNSEPYMMVNLLSNMRAMLKKLSEEYPEEWGFAKLLNVDMAVGTQDLTNKEEE